MDNKEWMDLARTNPNYIKGCHNFVNLAYTRLGLLHDKKILCSCTKCVNRLLKTRSEVLQHILYYRMMPSYVIWDNHGEEKFKEV